jgi:hypothetical protein
VQTFSVLGQILGMGKKPDDDEEARPDP